MLLKGVSGPSLLHRREGAAVRSSAVSAAAVVQLDNATNRRNYDQFPVREVYPTATANRDSLFLGTEPRGLSLGAEWGECRSCVAMRCAWHAVRDALRPELMHPCAARRALRWCRSRIFELTERSVTARLFLARDQL